MLEDLPILSLITFSPLLGLLVLLFIPKEKGRLLRGVAIAATLIPLVLACWLFVDFNQSGSMMQYKEQVDWIHISINKEDSQLFSGVKDYFFKFQYKMSVDGLSLALVLMTALISTMAALASVHIKKRWKLFYTLFLLLETGVFGVFLARDLFLFFLFFEVTLVPMFFLIGIWGYRERERAANKFLIYNGIGSAIMLIAFLILVNTAGFTIENPNAEANMLKMSYSGDIDTIYHNLTSEDALVHMPELGQGIVNPFHMSSTLRWSLFIMLLIAFGIKLPLFPFHTWMLKVHTEAPPPIVMIHSGILLKMGAYGLMRFALPMFPHEAKTWAAVLALLGVVNVIYGAVLAFRQTEFRLVLAYSSISHMGMVLLGLAALNKIGIEGAMFQLISHGLISALLFLIVGSLFERTGTTELHALGGLAKPMPFMSGMLLVGGLASLGLPGLSGFIGEWLPMLGLFDDWPVYTIIATLGMILAAAYVLRAVLRMTYGNTPGGFDNAKDARFIEALPMAALVAFIVLLGIYPSILTDPLDHSVDAILKMMSVKIGG